MTDGEPVFGQREDPGRLRLVLAILALAIGTVVFHRLGEGALAPPPPDPALIGDWLMGHDPLVSTAAILRLVVLGLQWYLLVTLLLGVLARGLCLVLLVRFTDLISPPFVPRLLRGALGVSVATALVTGPVAAPSRAQPPIPVTLGATEPLVVERGETAGAPEGEQIAPLPLELLDGPAAPQADHVVAPGDSLWSITRDALHRTLDREPTVEEVRRRWVAVIAANRDRLVDPDNPDLIFPGQAFVVPDDTGP